MGSGRESLIRGSRGGISISLPRERAPRLSATGRAGSTTSRAVAIHGLTPSGGPRKRHSRGSTMRSGNFGRGRGRTGSSRNGTATATSRAPLSCIACGRPKAPGCSPGVLMCASGRRWSTGSCMWSSRRTVLGRDGFISIGRATRSTCGCRSIGRALTNFQSGLSFPRVSRWSCGTHPLGWSSVSPQSGSTRVGRWPSWPAGWFGWRSARSTDLSTQKLTGRKLDLPGVGSGGVNRVV